MKNILLGLGVVILIILLIASVFIREIIDESNCGKYRFIILANSEGDTVYQVQRFKMINSYDPYCIEDEAKYDWVIQSNRENTTKEKMEFYIDSLNNAIELYKQKENKAKYKRIDQMK